MTIAGEQDVPLENKQQAELLKDIDGLESGMASASGIINYVTKRPVMFKGIDLAADHRGTVYGAPCSVLVQADDGRCCARQPRSNSLEVWHRFRRHETDRCSHRWRHGNLQH
ncbi:MAG: hypothetical protein ABI072_10815 [Edaphobacter sp.]